MAKEFSIPPVVFRSRGTSEPFAPYQRFSPTAPPRAANTAASSLPFMSFDLGSARPASSFSAPVLTGNIFSPGVIRGGESTSFDDEPPLLEELGINTRQIWRKTRSILNPFHIRTDLHEDADLSGPFLFLMAFGVLQLLAGKLHFGIILGWVTLAALFLYLIFNMLNGRSGNLDLHRCVSFVGYCMLPILMFSAVSLFLPQRGVALYALGAVSVLWSTTVSTKLLVDLAACGDEQRGLIAYACFLIYTLFSLLVMF